jgi:cytochrome c-type biogenesis protein CcmH/NrfG
MSSTQDSKNAIPKNRIDPMLSEARKNVSSDDLPRAIHAYQHLIRRNRSVQEIVPDLAQLIKKHPRDPQVWQLLGDALACTGDREHAEQSYAQSRKLMQQ